MKKQIKTFIILFLIFNTSEAQNHWAQRAGGVGSDRSYAITSDDSGNIYSTGAFSGIATFGTLTGSSYIQNGNDAFIVSYNAEGVVQWFSHAGGTGITEGYGISTDANRNVYITGFFTDTAWFGNAQLISTGQSDFFIAKLDSSGNFLWANKGGGISDDKGSAIRTDISGNIFVTGYITDSADFNGTILYCHGSRDVFTAKYDNAGSLLWIHNDGGLTIDEGNGIATDNSGNVIVTGSYRDSAFFSATQISSYGVDDIFVFQYNSAGIMQWVKHAGGSGDDAGYSIATDLGGNIHVTGKYFSSGIIQFDTTTVSPKGGNDFFIAKYDNAGSLLSVINDGSAGDEEAYGIAVDQLGNNYITGVFLDSIQLGSTIFTSNGGYDVFVAMYDLPGIILKAKQYGGLNDDMGWAITVDPFINCTSTGFFERNVKFGNTSLTSGANTDIFFVTLNDTISDAPGFIGSNFHTGNSGLLSNNISDIAIDGNNNVWVATRDAGIAFYDGSSWTAYDTSNSLIPVNKINSIFVDSLNVIWLGTPDSGLVKFDGTTWQYFSTSNSLIFSNDISSVTSFSGGPLWIGTNGDGCIRFNDPVFTLFDTSNSAIPDNFMTSMNVDSSHNYWIGTRDSGIAVYDGTTFTVYNTFNSGLPDNRINGAFIDDVSGKVWIATPSGLASFDGITWLVYNSSNGYPDNSYNDVAISKNGDISAGSTRKGTVVSNGSVQRVINTLNNLFDNNVIAIAVDTSGSGYWIGTQYNGVYLLQDTTSVVGIAELTVFSIFDIKSYPNPAEDLITIQYLLAEESDVEFRIYNAVGNMVASLEFYNEKKGVQYKHFSLNKIPSGIYIAKITAGDLTSVVKFVKE